MAKLHLTAYLENLDGGGALNALTPVNDTLSPLFQVVNTDFLRVPGEAPFIAGVYGSGDATVQPRARLLEASFRDTYKRQALEIPMLSPTAEPGSPPIFNDYRMDPIKLKPSNLLSYELLQNPAAAVDEVAVIFATDGPVQPVDPKGGYWARFLTTATAMTANIWNNRALTQDENLDGGRYEVLGMRALSTSLIAARLSFTNQVHRPGVLGADARGDVPHPSFATPGLWGVLGNFHTDSLPTVDFLVDAADNEAQPVDLYIRRIGN